MLNVLISQIYRTLRHRTATTISHRPSTTFHSSRANAFPYQSMSFSQKQRLPSGPRPNDAKQGPQGEPMTPILSASLVVLVPNASSSSISTMMLQRSARMGSSFRSAVVFPGGALDLADEAVVGCPTDVSSQDDMGNEKYSMALRLCALRETFEETGLLLLPSERKDEGVPWSRAVGHKEAGLSSTEWADWREKVHKNAAEFPTFLFKIASKIGKLPRSDRGSSTISQLPLANLAYHSHWITPRSVVRPGKRFSAHFFQTVLDGSDELSSSSTSSDSGFSLSADGSETTSLRVAPTHHFINATLRDEIILYPPQFYILTDLAETTQTSRTIQEKVRALKPLIFGHRQKEPTAVEEEPRNLQGRNYAWDRNTPQPTGWVSVTAVEPHALPGQGANIPLNFSKSNSAAQDEGDEDDSEPFVFPLVLPGDYQASPLQNAQFHESKEDWSSVPPNERPLNRVYVSPRMRKNGGGLIPRGAKRKGVAGLMDWQIGVEMQIKEDEESDEEDVPSNQSSSKARL